MMKRLACAALTIGLFATAAPASAQALGDVARQEKERRTTAKKAVKSFSNADLNPADINKGPAAEPTTDPAQCFESISTGKCASPEEMAKNSGADSPATAANPSAEVAQKEADWKANAEGLRVAIEKAQAEYAKLDATANDSTKSPRERATAARLLAQQQPMLDGLERKWWRLEKQAEDFRVPRAWLDPRPTLRTQKPQ